MLPSVRQKNQDFGLSLSGQEVSGMGLELGLELGTGNLCAFEVLFVMR